MSVLPRVVVDESHWLKADLGMAEQFLPDQLAGGAGPDDDDTLTVRLRPPLAAARQEPHAEPRKRHEHGREQDVEEQD